MIRIQAGVDADGLLVSLEASGHAGHGPKGQDLVCASVSFLLLTWGRLVEAGQGLEWESRPEKSGDFFLVIRKVASGFRERWIGAGTLVLRGLADLAQAYPENLVFKIELTNLEENHGSS